MNKRTKVVTQGAVIAALYVVLTLISNALGLASGAIQVRLSEALTILPAFIPAAVPGLFIGCLIANILCGSIIYDIIFGSLATLIGALGTYYFGRNKWLAPIFPIAANTLIVPFVLRYAYGIKDAVWYMALTVFIGEFITCGILGIILYKWLEKAKWLKA